MFRAALVALALLSPLTLAFYTEQRAEDAFITLRHSRNLASGVGLTYQPGERIQGFTSPAVALIAAAGFRAFGIDAVGPVMSLLRVVNLIGYGLAIFLILGELDWARHRRVVLVSVTALFALETKTAAFAINGMETGLLVGLLALAASVFARADRIPAVWIGLCWALVLWIRPDAAVYIGLMSAGAILWPPDGQSRTASIRLVGRATLWGGLMYLPWLLFAWIRYPNVVPQSIIAKSLRVGSFDGASLAGKLLDVPEVAAMVLLPPYALLGQWPWLMPAALLTGSIGMALFLLKSAPLAVRRRSLVAAGGVLYLTLLQGHTPWYFPAPFLFCLPAVAFVLDRGVTWAADRSIVVRVALGTIALVLLASVGLGWVRFAAQARAGEINDRSNRHQIGLWLRAHTKPDARVYLECPGFIGFYSGRKMLDYPGLVSPEVSAILRERGLGMAAPVTLLRPEWLVLRPHEFSEALADPALREQYRVVQVFDTRARLPAHIQDAHAILFNATFIVLQRVG